MKLTHKLGLAATTLTLAAGVTDSVVAATPASAATAASTAAVAKPHVVGLPANAPKPGAISPKDDTDIQGYYYWNGDGFTGTLDIYSQVNGSVEAVLYDSGNTEYLSGEWFQSSNQLDFAREIGTGSTAAWQYYTYYLGGEIFNSNPAMFGGYYTTSASGNLTRGSYLDKALY